MKTFSVVIPTTHNLVGISDITVEDPMVSSVICVNNNLQALPISNQYDSFVKTPTGIIEKITGNSSFRTDLTSHIDQGDSWQLALAIAHVLHKSNKIVFSNVDHLIMDGVEKVIWASGLIDSSLSVKSISFLDKKIFKSLEFFNRCIEKNIKVFLALSCENAKEANIIFSKNKILKEAVQKNKIIILSLNNLAQFFEEINLDFLFNVKLTYNNFLPNLKKKIKFISVFLLLMSMIFYSYIIWNNLQPWFNLIESHEYRTLLTKLSSSRQGNFNDRVSAFLFDYFQTNEFNNLNKQIILNFIPSQKLNTLSLDNKNEISCLKDKRVNYNNKHIYFDKYCLLNVELTNIGQDKVFLWILNFEIQNKVNLKSNYNKTKAKITTGSITSSETLSLNLKRNDKQFILFFVYGKNYDNNIRKWLENLSNGDALINSTARRIKSLGFGYQIKEIKNVTLINNIL